MNLTLEQAISQKIMISFNGTELPDGFADALRKRPIAGVTLFRHLNVADPAQVRRLTASLQAAAQEAGLPPLLIGADQEGGQLMAIGQATPFPGNMALGATGSSELARRAGQAMARELAAMGINVSYTPVCDVNVNPLNPVVGTRAFGEDPSLVGRLAAAMVEGVQSTGVAAAAKHFPGHGDTAGDSHYDIPTVPHGAERLRKIELPPFAAAIQAGARLVMTSHVALPALNNGQLLPATLSPAVLQGLLRKELGFAGPIISDAMDMHAIHQGEGLPADAIAAAQAGVDLLVLKHSFDEEQRVYNALLQAARRGSLPVEAVLESARRVLDLKTWLQWLEQPPLEIVGCPEHQDLALEIARRSLTLVRDTAGLLPLHLPSTARVAAVCPQPADLTPADTSSYVTPSLAAALRRFHPSVDEFIIPLDPDQAGTAMLFERLAGYDLVVIGTINALNYTGQAALVQALVAAGRPLVAVALRLPYDLVAYPAVPTYLCTYSILPPAMQALAEALWGQIPFLGRLPVTIPEPRRVYGPDERQQDTASSSEHPHASL